MRDPSANHKKKQRTNVWKRQKQNMSCQARDMDFIIIIIIIVEEGDDSNINKTARQL